MKKLLIFALTIAPLLAFAQRQTFTQPAYFGTNVFLHDSTNTPLHLRIPTGAVPQIVDGVLTPSGNLTNDGSFAVRGDLLVETNRTFTMTYKPDVSTQNVSVVIDSQGTLTLRQFVTGFGWYVYTLTPTNPPIGQLSADATYARISGQNFTGPSTGAFYSVGNVQTGENARVLGGTNNIAGQTNAVVVGGLVNAAHGRNAFIGAGQQNAVSGDNGAVPGGRLNTAGNNSFAAGSRANASFSNSFVWGDGHTDTTTAPAANTFNARAQNGHNFYGAAGLRFFDLSAIQWGHITPTNSYLPGMVMAPLGSTAAPGPNGKVINYIPSRIDFFSTNKAFAVAGVFNILSSGDDLSLRRGGLEAWAYDTTNTLVWPSGSRGSYVSGGLHNGTEAIRQWLWEGIARGTNYWAHDVILFMPDPTTSNYNERLKITAEGVVVATNGFRSTVGFTGPGSNLTGITAASLVITNSYTGGVMRLVTTTGTNFYWE